MIVARIRRMLVLGVVLGAAWAMAWAAAPAEVPPPAAEAPPPAAEAPPPAADTPAADTSPEMREWTARMKTAELAFRTRDYAKAEAELSAGIKVAESFGDTDQRLSAVLARLMQCYSVQGKFAQAIGPGQRLLALREKVDGPEHTTVAMVLNDLGGQYNDDGQPEKAKPLYARALAICQKTGAKAAPLQGLVLYNMAELERDGGNLEVAEKNARESLAVRKAAFGTGHGWYAQSLEMLGTILLAKKEYVQAEEVLRQNLVIRRLKSGWNRPVIMQAMTFLADACKAQKKFEEAGNYYRQALQRGKAGLGRKDDIRATTLEAYADLLRQTGKPDEATKLDEQAKAIREALEKK